MGHSLCWIKFDSKLICCLAFTLIIADFLFDNDNDNDNDNILFDHNILIEISIFNSLENQITKLVWRLLLKQIN